MLSETLIDLSKACVVFTVRVPDGTGIVCAGWPTPDGPAWVALPIEDDAIPPEALLTTAQHVPVGMVEALVHYVATGASGCWEIRGRKNVLMTPYYQDEACTLYHATAEAVLPTLPEKSVHLVLVDPPYFRVKEEAWDRQWKHEAAYLDWLRWLCMEWQRLLTPNGSLYCFASPQMAWQVEGIIREHFHVLNHLLWQKTTGNATRRANKEDVRAFLPNTEHIIFAEQCTSDSAASDTTGYHEATRLLHKRVYRPIGAYLEQERLRAGFTKDMIDVALGYVRTKDPSRGTELCRRWEEGERPADQGGLLETPGRLE